VRRIALTDFIATLLDLYLPRERQGQSLVEYALIIVLIAIAVIAAVVALSGQIQSVFSKITTSLGGV
jgi:pilus assembly protein Flp/PilA